MPKAKPQTQNAKIAKGALRLAAKKDWSLVTLEAIAKEAKIPLPMLKKCFFAPHEIVPVIIREVTREALAKAGKTPGTPRDVLFDLLMARFDVMQKDRKAILSINNAMRYDPALSYVLVRTILESLGTMIDVTKLDMSLRSVLVAKLTAIYGWAFLAWSKDNTRDMSKTMAALDQALRLDEKTMKIFKQCF
jgi:hypothetical protein